LLERLADELAALERIRAKGRDRAAVEKRERDSLSRRAESVDARSEGLKTVLEAVYGNPTLAGFQWERHVADYGEDQAARLVQAKPEVLGALRGRTWLFGLVETQGRREALQAVSQIAPASAEFQRAKAGYVIEKWQRERTIEAALASPEVIAGRQAAADLDRHGINAAGIRQQARDLSDRLKKAEQLRQAEDRAIASTVAELKRHTLQRDRGAAEYRDDGAVWQAMPAPLKEAIGTLTGRTEDKQDEVFAALADKLRRDPAALKLVQQHLAQAVRRSRSFIEPEPPDLTPSRSRPGPRR
jgi:hypothetical protein